MKPFELDTQACCGRWRLTTIMFGHVRMLSIVLACCTISISLERVTEAHLVGLAGNVLGMLLLILCASSASMLAGITPRHTSIAARYSRRI
ncbi:hypothetical protein BDR04DRAFT_714031 [Suillus decipiens]|nr:hypothetical protein BDR04DRAFT_714031 [Suillus decipiens]